MQERHRYSTSSTNEHDDQLNIFTHNEREEEGQLMDLDELINLEVEQLEWYHPNLTRHQSEALLIQNGCEGSYLLRESQHKSASQRYTLSCRCANAVKHFPIGWDGMEYTFGMGKFPSLDDFVRHFKNKPLIGGESGILTLLKDPYPRDIEEPEEYESVHVHAEWGKQLSSNKTPTLPSSINSKEGYLTKQGGLVKSWKERWFVLQRNELKYFKTKGEREAIRTLNLEQCSNILDESGAPGKKYSFAIEMPGRTFLLVASSESDKKDWLKLLKWKLEKIKEEGHKPDELAV